MQEYALIIVALLFTKHFIVDFPLQPRYMYSNKGTYGHFGGILHAWAHGVGTWLCFAFYTKYAILYAVVDMLIHYHVDWAKVQINKRTGWGPNTNEEFWWLLGLDQFLHAMTYIGLVVYFVS